jgi:hypothetical protein
MKNEELRTLVEYNSVEIAGLTKAMLDSMGVENEIIHDTTAGLLTPMHSGVKILVREKDYDRAMALLEAKYDKEEFKEETKK